MFTPLLVPKLEHFLCAVWGECALLTFSMWPLSRLSLAERLGSPCPAASPGRGWPSLRVRARGGAGSMPNCAPFLTVNNLCRFWTPHWSGEQENRLSLLAQRCPADLEVCAHFSPLPPNSGRRGHQGWGLFAGRRWLQRMPSPSPPRPKPLGGFLALRDPEKGCWVLSPEGAAGGRRWFLLLPPGGG